MSIEQERAEFEAWLQTHCDYDDLHKSEIELARDAWQAALQSQDRELSHLEKDRIAMAAHAEASKIPGATFYNAAMLALGRVKMQSQDRKDATSSEMSAIADRYAHVLAMHLECILLNYDGAFSDDSLRTLGEYRDAMSKIHERESPTYMGEPVIGHARRVEEES